MKNLIKILTIFSFVLITNLALAQESDTLKAKPYVYCEIIGSSILFENKIYVGIDYGQELRLMETEFIKTADKRRPVKFNSMIDALNYMSEQGWEFVQAYVTISGTDSTTHWILKKRKE